MNGHATQADKVMRWLQSGKSLTPLTALRKWGIMRLAARCHDLRAAGVSIKTTIVKRSGRHWASYSWG